MSKTEIKLGGCYLYQGMQVVVEKVFKNTVTVTCWGGPNDDKLLAFRGVKIRDLKTAVDNN